MCRVSARDVVVETNVFTCLFFLILARSDAQKKCDEFKCSEATLRSSKLNSETMMDEVESPVPVARMPSKVTFESLLMQTSLPSSPKMKDQSVMVQMEYKGPSSCPLGHTDSTTSQGSATNNGLTTTAGELTSTTNVTFAKSSIKELVNNQKLNSRRKSKSQNRARKALRTITFILGMLQPSFRRSAHSSTPPTEFVPDKSLPTRKQLDCFDDNPLR